MVRGTRATFTRSLWDDFDLPAVGPVGVEKDSPSRSPTIDFPSLQAYFPLKMRSLGRFSLAWRGPQNELIGKPIRSFEG